MLPLWIIRSLLLMYWICETVLELSEIKAESERRAVPFYDLSSGMTFERFSAENFISEGNITKDIFFIMQ